MRAITITAADGPAAVTLTERPTPTAQAGEVQLRVAAAGVNPADTFMWEAVRSGALPTPMFPGLDAAGTVTAVGAGVDHVGVGDTVMAVVNARRPEGGAQAEMLVLPAASVVRVPDGVDSIAASTLPMTGLTALEGLRLIDLSPGATLAVTGASGMLGSYVIPLAKARGLRVIADAKPGDEELLSSFGAHHVVPRGERFVDHVRQIAPAGVDAVYDTAGITRAAVPVIADGGAIAVIRGWDNQGAPERDITVHTVSVGNAMSNTEWLEQLADAASTGALKLRVASTYPPERAMDAYKRMNQGGLNGRLVITF